MKTILTCLVAVVVSGVAMAQTYPFQASLTPDHAVYARTATIEGLTLSVWGENPQTGLALGLANGSIGQSAGLSLGLLNYAENYKGMHWGLVNCTSGDFAGWQGGPLFGLLVSVLNHTGGTMKGLQLGLVNCAGRLEGLQLGLVNYTAAAGPGVQIGIANIIPENTCWFGEMPNAVAPAMILVNWRF